MEDVVVEGVSEESPAYGMVAKNDVIEEVDHKPVSDLKNYEKIVSKVGPSDTVLLLIYRNGGHLYVAIKYSGGRGR